jgi:hypothetical protein
MTAALKLSLAALQEPASFALGRSSGKQLACGKLTLVWYLPCTQGKPLTHDATVVTLVVLVMVAWLFDPETSNHRLGAVFMFIPEAPW